MPADTIASYNSSLSLAVVYLTRSLYLIVFASLLALVSVQVYAHHAQLWMEIESMRYTLLGLAVGMGLSLWRVPQGSFYATLRHELCHWLFAVLSLAKPMGLNVADRHGGYFRHSGRMTYALILSPYFFPLTAYSLLIVSVFFHSPTLAYYVLVGMALGFDTVCIARDYHLRQTDWQRYSLPFSIAFSMIMWMLCTLLLLLLLWEGFGGLLTLLDGMTLRILNLMPL